MRDVLENERELDFYKTQYVASCVIMLITHKSDPVLDLHKQLIKSCFPWEKSEEEKPDQTEDAVQRFKAMQESGTIDSLKRDVSANEVFTTWRDPLQNEEPQ